MLDNIGRIFSGAACPQVNNMASSQTSPNAASEWESGSAHPTEDSVHAALRSLLGDSRFKASARNRSFLKFVVEETLAGGGDKIKSYSIAVDVFGRSEAFDAATDPIVRIEATRLRSALAAYYAGPGQHQRVRIDLPKGGYVPSFSVIALPDGGTTAAPSAVTETRNRLPLAVGITALAAVLAALVVVVATNLSWLGRTWGVTGSVVLLEPTAAMSNDAAEAQRARGLDQSVVTALTRFRGLQVILLEQEKQRLEVLQNHERGDAQIYLVKSSIRSDADLLRIWWSLSNARTGEVIWSETVDRTLGGITTQVDDEIASRIAIQIGAPTGVVSDVEVRQ